MAASREGSCVVKADADADADANAVVDAAVFFWQRAGLIMIRNPFRLTSGAGALVDKQGRQTLQLRTVCKQQHNKEPLRYIGRGRSRLIALCLWSRWWREFRTQYWQGNESRCRRRLTQPNRTEPNLT